MVRSDMKGRGLGFQLMRDIIGVARARKVGVLHGDVLAENTTMLRMAQELGFRRKRKDGDVVEVIMEL
jgi:acetyltransferase